MTTLPPVDPRYPVDVASLPPRWRVVMLGQVFRDMRSGFSCPDYTDRERGIAHLRAMNVDRSGLIVREQLKYVVPSNDLRLAGGDVLFNYTNSAEHVGKSAPVEHPGDWGFSNHMTRLRPSRGLSYRF